MITPADVALYRLRSQHLLTATHTTAAAAVRSMGAMQAQDYDMAKWAIGVRWPGSTERLVEDAIQRGDVLRTHILRPTWHFVAATDIDWLLDLTAPHVERSLAARKRELELDAALLARSWRVMEEALAGHTYLTREEVMGHLNRAGIVTDARSYYLMFHAEQAGIVCSGPCRGKNQTYALLRERVPLRRSLPRDEALAELVNRYFASHGPATLADFCWWSGLTRSDARRGIDGAGASLVGQVIDGRTYWLSEAALNTPLPTDESIHFLPAFDEFLVSYAHRSASLNPDFTAATITANGIFKPVIVVNGQVVGLWKRTNKPRYVAVETTFFYELPVALTERIRAAAHQYAAFSGKDLRLNTPG